MSSFDNEIYRGPPEAGPTLEHDIRSYGSDVYILKAEKNTLAQDVPPTEEPIRQESKPVQKKESKIAKAMKLLASCTAAVAVVATLTAPAPSTPAVDRDLSEWPQFGKVEMDSAYSFRTRSDHSHICQVSVSGRTYRFEALQEDLHMAWHESNNYEEDGSRGGFYMHMDNLQEGWDIILDISLIPQDREEPTEALGTIKTKTGDTLYIRSFFLGGDDSPPEQLQSIIDNLSSYVRITDARDDGWGKVFVGDTILSNTSPEWNGRMTIDPDELSINRIHYASDYGFNPAEAQVQRKMNGIQWSFFYAPDNDGDPCFWMVPSHEDLALGLTSYQVCRMLGITSEMLEENPYIVDELLPEFADLFTDRCLSYYHLADVDIDPPDWSNATQPPEDSLDNSEYFHAAEFSLGQRSFRMDSMQDDVSIRHFYTGPEESEEFDLWFAGDDTHVKLVLSTHPDGKEFYEYAYPGFDPVYYALYSWSDHPMSASELDTLAYDIPNYINITELTATPEISPVFTEEYFNALEFSFEGHTFRMDSLRNDVSFRQIWQGEDHVQFDFRADDENLRVQLIVGAYPNGAAYYPYYLTNGTELFVAAFNNWGEPWLADEQTLAALAQNLSAYVYIDETTEPVLPEPYPEMDEFVQYHINYDVRLQHTEFAKSGRVCQFVTDRGNYRMLAQSPEIFIIWEDYYYDVKEEMGNSRISIRHYEEGWSIEAWIFNDPVESVYQGFPMTAEDGSQLWFYLSQYPETYDDAQLQSLIDRLPELVTLSAANDDDWGKVRIGETLISHNNQYWNGLAYTSGGFDFWYFEKLLDSHALSGYDLQHAGQRIVNGITWDFYTLGSPSGYPTNDGKDYYFTEVYVVCGQEDLWLQTSLSYGLSPSESLFASQAEYEASLDKEMAAAIDTIVNTGLIHYYPYP